MQLPTESENSPSTVTRCVLSVSQDSRKGKASSGNQMPLNFEISNFDDCPRSISQNTEK